MIPHYYFRAYLIKRAPLFLPDYMLFSLHIIERITFSLAFIYFLASSTFPSFCISIDCREEILYAPAAAPADAAAALFRRRTSISAARAKGSTNGRPGVGLRDE